MTLNCSKCKREILKGEIYKEIWTIKHRWFFGSFLDLLKPTEIICLNCYNGKTKDNSKKKRKHEQANRNQEGRDKDREESRDNPEEIDNKDINNSNSDDIEEVIEPEIVRV